MFWIQRGAQRALLFVVHSGHPKFLNSFSLDFMCGNAFLCTKKRYIIQKDIILVVPKSPSRWKLQFVVYIFIQFAVSRSEIYLFEYLKIIDCLGMWGGLRCTYLYPTGLVGNNRKSKIFSH